ncbi:MAG: CHAT domain-containing protein [Myxococcota bacterium]
MRCLPTQAPLRLLLTPAPDPSCLLAREGQLTLTLHDPQRQPLFAWTGRLSSLPSTPEGLRLELPAPLETAGLYHLDLRWSCGNNAAEQQPAERLRTFPFLLEGPDPTFEASKKELRTQLKGASSETRARAYQHALSQPQTPMSRLWLYRRWVRALLDAGHGAQAEPVALAWNHEARQLGRSAEQVWALSMAQEAARQQETLPRARGYLQQARGLAQTQDVPEALAELWYNDAYLLDLLGEPLAALEATAQALNAARASEDNVYEEATRLLELDLLQGLGQHHTVREKLRSWLSQPPTGVYSAGTLAWLVTRAVEAGTPPGLDTPQSLQAAENMLLQALNTPEAQQNLTARAHTLANLGLVRLLLGDLPGTQQRLQQAQEAAPPGEITLQLFLLTLDVRLKLAQGTPSTLRLAQHLATQLEQKGQALLQNGDAGEGAYFQGEIATRLGQPEAALQHYARALTHLETEAGHRTLLYRASVRTSRMRWEEAQIKCLLQLGRPLEALEQAERSTWTRQQALRRSAQRAQLSPRQQAEVDERKQHLDLLERELVRLYRMPAIQPFLTERETVEQERARQWDQLQTLLSSTQPTPPPPLEAARLAQLPTQTLRLRYLLLSDRLVVWEQEKGGTLQVRNVPVSRGTVEALTEAYRTQAQAGKLDAETGRQLSAWLLGPRAQERRLPSQLWVVAEGALRSLPWNALPTPHGFLLERSVITFVSSLLSDGGQAPATGPALLVADPARDLPQTVLEVDKIATTLSTCGYDIKRLQHEAVTHATLSERLPQSALIHYAGHAKVDESLVFSSALLLSRGERLRLSEVRSLNLKAGLVFLNACGSALSSVEVGGAHGLADAFASAGAAHVVATLWDVPDIGGQRVAQTFYQHLCAQPPADPGMALAEALRARLRDTGPAGAQLWSGYLVLRATPP